MSATIALTSENDQQANGSAKASDEGANGDRCVIHRLAPTLRLLNRAGHRYLPLVNRFEVIDQRLNCENSRVLAVSVHQFSREGLGDTSLGGDSLPVCGASFAKPVNQWRKNRAHGRELFPVYGNLSTRLREAFSATIPPRGMK